MVSRRDQPGQFSLFDDDPDPASSSSPHSRRGRGPAIPIDPAPTPAATRDLAARLPPNLYLGTSSWSFPGWAGLVYARGATTADLARRGLPAYASNPIFRTVGLDRTFYAPIPESQFAAYSADVPEGFRFLVKAHNAVTRPDLEHGGANPRFLDPAYAADAVIEPAARGLGPKLGPILFQFSPMPLRTDRARAHFIDRLAAFLADLPRGPLYAVELRNRNLLIPAYAEAIASAPRSRVAADDVDDSGVCHAFNIHPTMPPPEAQAALIPPESSPAMVLRWMLHPGQTYEGTRDRYAPFNRIVDDDPGNRAAAAELCARALSAGRPTWVIANNKAEGSSPLTIAHLAGAIAAELAPSRE